MDYREEIIRRMRADFAASPEAGRWVGPFYLPRAGTDKRTVRYNRRQAELGAVDISTLEDLPDEGLLDAFETFSRRKYVLWG